MPEETQSRLRTRLKEVLRRYFLAGLLVFLPVLRWGLHRPLDTILTLRGREITVETDRPLSINVDGEVRTHTPARFRIIPRAIEVFVPSEA